MLEPKDFKTDSTEIIEWIDQYLNNISDFPVKSPVAPGDIYGQKISSSGRSFFYDGD